MMDQFEVKVGDKLWSMRYGWGKVTRICKDDDYPLCLEFENGYYTFTREFKEYKEEINQSLFWDEIKFEIPKKPLPKLKVNAVLEVWDLNSKQKEIRHFSHFEDGKVNCFLGGKTSFTHTGTSDWENFKVIKEEI
jgi:hypothetical protein